MPLAIRSHSVVLRIDDDTWEALEGVAQARGEPAADLVVYAIEAFLEQRGFVPEWAQQPLEVQLPGRRRPQRSR